MRSYSREIEDMTLLENACNNGCVKSLAELHNRFGPTICKYIQRSGADGLAEDISQLVFVRICEGRCRYGGNASVKSYLCGVARNILYEQLRLAKIRTCPLSPAELAGNARARNSEPQMPIETLESAERRQILKKGIEKLHPKSRQAIELVHIQGLPASKAAASIGCDFNTFRARLTHALRALRVNLKDV